MYERELVEELAKKVITRDIKPIKDHMNMDINDAITVLRIIQGQLYTSNEQGWTIYEAFNKVIDTARGD